MIGVTDKFKEQIASGNHKWFVQALITLNDTDNTVLTIDNSRIWADGFTISSAVSSQSSFSIGNTVIDELTLKIIYDDYTVANISDFVGAKVVVNIGLYENFGDENPFETFQKGVYFVDEVSMHGNVITLSCLDDMALFDTDYSQSTLSYPATLLEIVTDIATVCGVTFEQTEFPNSTYSVSSRPEKSSITCRDILGMVCSIACCNGHIDRFGKLVISFFDEEFFHDDGSPDFQVTSLNSLEADTEAVLITGVKVGDVIVGSNAYCIELSDNDLISNEEDIADSLANTLVGMTFYPFEASIPADPTIEAGDTVVITDTKGNNIRSLITEVEFKVTGSSKIACHAESYSVSKSQRYSEASKVAERAATSVTERTMSAYNTQVQRYTELIANAYGMYRSEIDDPYNENAKVYALHNKPTYGESTYATIVNDQGFFVGNRTSSSADWEWKAGIASDGSAFFKVLAAQGITADQITGKNIYVETTEKAQFGNFAFLPRSDGSLMFLKIKE